MLLFFIGLTVNAQTLKTTNGKVYDTVDVMPEYPGGFETMVKFLSSNMIYPKEAQKKGLEGRSLVSFIVEKDGALSNITVKKSAGKMFDDEAMRVVKKMPKWKPGRKDGKLVRVHFNLPVQFSLK
nr:energy transducer TonB [Prevotella sp.]